LRVPLKQNSSLQNVPIPLRITGSSQNVFIHPDTTVDIAVISTVPSNQRYDFSYLPASFLTTREDFKSLDITEGDEVFFTGMFTSYIGEKANHPIVRFGKVALITD
jgi:hypothetical protein